MSQYFDSFEATYLGDSILIREYGVITQIQNFNTGEIQKQTHPDPRTLFQSTSPSQPTKKEENKETL
jgi:hypothetical protein